MQSLGAPAVQEDEKKSPLLLMSQWAVKPHFNNIT